jgi:glycerophosphoryl diester phosphodiesterase
MSFNHWLLEDARALNCQVPLGLTAEGNDDLFNIHTNCVNAYDIDFVSYGISDLPNRFVKDFRKSGKPVISWTIRTPEQMAKSALYADQITFEGFMA